MNKTVFALAAGAVATAALTGCGQNVFSCSDRTSSRSASVWQDEKSAQVTMRSGWGQVYRDVKENAVEAFKTQASEYCNNGTIPKP